METKQFPEKWAVRDNKDTLGYLYQITSKGLITEHLFNFNSCNTNNGYLFLRKQNADLVYEDRFPDGYTEVTLEELIAHYEPTTHPKWMPLTRGNFEFHVFEEFENRLWGRIKHSRWTYFEWQLNGKCMNGGIDFDLIPYNTRIHELEEKITSKRSELAELEGELKTLKGK